MEQDREKARRGLGAMRSPPRSREEPDIDCVRDPSLAAQLLGRSRFFKNIRHSEAVQEACLFVLSRFCACAAHVIVTACERAKKKNQPDVYGRTRWRRAEARGAGDPARLSVRRFYSVQT